MRSKKSTALRLLIVITSVLFSFILTAAFTLIPPIVGIGWPYGSQIGSLLAVFSWTVGLVAWLILLVMGVAWAFGRRLHRAIPVTGTIIGSISILPWLPLIIPIVTLLPALVLAVRLVRFHMGHSACEPAV